MKLLIHTFIIGIILIFLSSYSHCQIYSVTFKVDMSEQTLSDKGVHLAGSFQTEAGFDSDWDPASTEMVDSNSDTIYEVTLDIPEGVYEYKFVNGNSWEGGENPPDACTVGSYNNRQIEVYSNIDLIPVLFDSCNAQLNFAVNMQGVNVDSEGVHVMGDFQKAAGYNSNWDPTSIEMTDPDNDGVYETEITVTKGDYQYLFINGSTEDQAEAPPESCTIENKEGMRVRTASAITSVQGQTVYCYNTCDICDPSVSTDYQTYWWNDAVFYEIFVRSFYDSDGDGIGDFQGIIEKLDYLNDGDSTTTSDLGIRGIWLMPVNASPSYHGYDITDYYITNPDYGSMEDFEELLSEAHERGIKVIIDFVMNHSSDQHPWFNQSVNNENGYRDWYIWRQTDPGSGGWHYRNGAYYYGLFWGGMPDLNYKNNAVKEEMFDISEFWLNKGVDGFRLDAIKHLYEDTTGQDITETTLNILGEFNDVYKGNNPDAFTVGEVWAATEEVIPFVQNDRLDACFEFSLAESVVDAVNSSNPEIVLSQMNDIIGEYPRLQYSTFLSNHDQNRVFSQLGRDDGKMKQAASIYLTLPGIPFIYYGEEVGMTGTGDHINIRRPMQWTDGINAGFSSTAPWNEPGDNYDTNNVAKMQDDSTSILAQYKRYIHIRNEQDPLRKGYFVNLTTENGSLLSYARIYGDQAVLFFSNLGNEKSEITSTLDYSSLSMGTYEIRNILDNQTIGDLDIDSEGGFDKQTFNSQTIGAKKSMLFSLSKQEPTSIVNHDERSLDISVYPNPTNEYFRIILNNKKLNISRVEVYNMLGNLVYKVELKGKQITVPTNQWTKGSYIVIVRDGRTVGVKRILVQ